MFQGAIKVETAIGDRDDEVTGAWIAAWIAVRHECTTRSTHTQKRDDLIAGVHPAQRRSHTAAARRSQTLEWMGHADVDVGIDSYAAVYLESQSTLERGQNQPP